MRCEIAMKKETKARHEARGHDSEPRNQTYLPQGCTLGVRRDGDELSLGFQCRALQTYVFAGAPRRHEDDGLHFATAISKWSSLGFVNR